ncbi:hypothetical protein TrRE_jg3193, partial [Triparma retinervis]
SLDPLASCAVVIEGKIGGGWVAVGTVSNFTDFHSRSMGVRGGVKKMIQIRKNFCHSIEGRLEVGTLWGALGGEIGMDKVPRFVLLWTLDRFLCSSSFLSAEAYEPGEDDATVWGEIMRNGGLTLEEYESFKGLKRWAECVGGVGGC